MDQAVSLLAQAGRAMHVEFNPVSGHGSSRGGGSKFDVDCVLLG
jgi:hypothetical protein